MNNEPSRIEILLTKAVYRTVGKSTYKGFADIINVPKSANIMDFGSGLGTIAYYLLPRIYDSHLTCVDVSDKWLTSSRKTLRKYENVSYLKGNIDKLTLAPNSFDVVYSHFVLHDISDAELCLIIPVLVKLLKHNGTFYIREPLESEPKINYIKQLLLQDNMTIIAENEVNVLSMGRTLNMIVQKLP